MRWIFQIIYSSRSPPRYQLFSSSRLFVNSFSDIRCSQMTKNLSQTGRAHLLLISETPGREGGALGIVTLEGLFFCFT